MLIENTQKHLYSVELSPTPVLDENGEHVKSFDAKLDREVPKYLPRPPVEFAPGVSRITQAQFESISDNEGFQYRLENDAPGQSTPYLVLVSEDDALPDDAKQAHKIVQKTFDPDLLRDWMNAQTDRRTLELLELQILKVENPREYMRRSGMKEQKAPTGVL